MSEAPPDRPGRLFVAADGTGNFQGVPAIPWTERRHERPDGSVSVSYHAKAIVSVPSPTGARRGQVKFYQVRPSGASVGAAPPLLQYYCDYGLAGEVDCGGRRVPVLLVDSACRGEFHLDPASVVGSPLLWLDLNGDGQSGAGEITPAIKPFEVDGKWWALTNLQATGSVQVVASAKPVVPASAEPAGPDLSPGRKAPAFTAQLADGRPVKFPDDFKGKVVLLDFWATWCGPCIAELPNVQKAYEQYHLKGFEILGVSLDRADAAEQLKAFIAKHKLPWAQVYDGKGWKAEVGQLYGIRAIPHMLLVDGDTGIILANKDIRGDRLAPAIAKALGSKTAR